jgi:hypothetical protein
MTSFRNQGISRPSPWHHNATTNAPRAISATTHFRDTVIPPASSKHPSVKSRDQQDNIHASLCCCPCNRRREACRSTPGRACFLSTRRYPLGTHLGLRHLKPYNQACSPCGDTNASQRNSMLRTSRCRLRCFMTTIIPSLVEHGGQPF